MMLPKGLCATLRSFNAKTSVYFLMMKWFFEKILLRILAGHSARRQIVPAILWLGDIVNENDVILIVFPRYRRLFRFAFPIYPGDTPRRVTGKEATPTFLIGTPEECRKNTDDSRTRIFGSPLIEIWENKKRTGDVLPLRFGLTDEEKKTAFQIARDAITAFLANGAVLEDKYFLGRSRRFSIKADVGVALWVDGKIRGSWVAENNELGRGIALAGRGASRDIRFKPLAKEELDKTRIEITVMNYPRIPLSPKERVNARIYSEKGYMLEDENGRHGWFLPEVFNAKRFENLQEFLGDLAQKKAGIKREAWRTAKISVFEVDDFIESHDRSRPLRLLGPVVDLGGEIVDLAFVMKHARAAADWLCSIQEEDGNMPPVIDPLFGTQKQINLPPLAFTAWALAELGHATREEKYTQAARKSFAYLKKYILTDAETGTAYRDVLLAYVGQLALALGETKSAEDAALRIKKRLSNIEHEPITLLQVGNFFKQLKAFHLYAGIPLTIAKRIFETASAQGGVMNLAVWAEAVNAFRGTDDAFAIRVKEWLVSRQLSNGSFPATTSGGIPYTRGTGKIFETLALEPQKNMAVLEKTLTWLFSMQYDKEKAFFIRPLIYPSVEGAFRHDDVNQEAWIDAAGHLLLGVARFANAYPNNEQWK